MSDLDKEKESLEAGKTYFSSELDDKVELKGTLPTSGNVTISNQNSVASAILVINGYTINYNGLDESYTINNGNTSSNDNCNNNAMFTLTLKERNMAIELEQDTNWLKSFVDKALKEMFTSVSGVTEIETEEIIKLQNGNYTWSSKNTDIIEINGNKVTPKKIGNAIVAATTDKGAEVRIKLKVNETVDLSENVAVGDYVDYDAGAWTNSVALPTSQGQFGGYTAGKNRANSISVCDRTAGSTSLKGWRVLSVDKNTNTVTIIHAGQPECYFHYGNSSDGATNLNNRATSEYLNDTYASSAHMMNRDEGLAMDSTIRVTGSTYWLASPYASNNMYRVYSSGYIDAASAGNVANGLRPIVVLKSNIKTTGKTTDAVGQEAWSLVAP